MRISDWSTDVCSSDLKEEQARHRHQQPASDHSHAAHAALRRVEAVQPGTFDKAHSAGAGPAPSRWVSRLVKMRFRCGPSHLSRSSARVNPAGTITSVSIVDRISPPITTKIGRAHV